MSVVTTNNMTTKTEKLTNDNPRPPLDISTIHLHGDKLFHLPAVVNGTPTYFLFDTGANFTILDKRVYDAIDAAEKPPLTKTIGNLFGAGGETLHLYGCFDATVNISQTGSVTFKNCLVADLNYKGALFGIQEMFQLGTILDMKQGTIELNNHIVALHYNYTDYPTTALCSQDCTVPAVHSLQVQAHSDTLPPSSTNSPFKIFRPQSDLTLPNPTIAPHTLFLADEESFPILITNFSDEPCHLKKGSLLGILSLAVDVKTLPPKNSVNYVSPTFPIKTTLSPELEK